MMFEYDQEIDVLYVVFKSVGPGEVKRSRSLDERRLLDLDAEGEPVGVEFLCASEGVHLDGVPRADEIAQVIKSLVPA